jgi:ATP-dependent DNA helicase RecG
MSTAAGARYTPETDVQFVKGVGPPLAKVLAKLSIATLGDLVFHLPRRYEDRANLVKIRDVRPGDYATLKGRIISLDSKNAQGRMTVIRAAISDETGAIGLIWFNQRWIKPRLEKHRGEIIVYGQVKEGSWGYEISTPEWETIDPDDAPEDFARITPVYPLADGVSQKTIRRAVRKGLAYVDSFVDPLPDKVRADNRLKGLAWALKHIHLPDSDESRVEARRRLVFDEFFHLQLALAVRRRDAGLQPGIAFDANDSVLSEVEQVAGFPLTRAQKRVVLEIFDDMREPSPMNRLLQGDVGSGKTLVAAAAMLVAVRSGYQAALMAPTEILAEQHFSNLKPLFARFGVECELLVGKQTAADKKRALKHVAEGKAEVVIGTHALIQEAVEFPRLGLAVIDEQHRFGVMQRAALRQKGKRNPDVLVMTATPIPRSLTLTIYGDLNVSVIDEMPPGRKPIRTHWKQPAERQTVYGGARKLLAEGAQAYVICPLVSESEKMLAQAAEHLFERMRDEVFKEFRVGLLHGQQKPKVREEAMELFRCGDIDVLVTTTVIEVGVDVPNASLMIIEDASRFGLSQMHQLRGRVGRGERQSYCILVGGAATPDAEARLRVMARTSDGFEIAEEDLRIRGPGELYGTKQSGAFELRVADLIQDGVMIEQARRAAAGVLALDPELARPEHAVLLERVSSETRLAATDVS